MSFNNNITPGAPPLLWSNIYEAFTKINENFDILVATIGTGSGLTPINFETLDTSVSPSTDNLYSLGSAAFRWKKIRTGEYIAGGSDSENGLWAGTAHIKGIAGTIDLPTGSTVNGNLIIDPDKTFFKEIQVDNNLSVVATQFSDSFNLLSGSGISLSVNSSSDSIEIDNTGILSVSSGLGISTATVAGVATITNNGVRSIQGITALPAGRTLGAGINISAGTGDNIKITNAGVISISSGVGITVSTDIATGDVTITNSAPAVNAFTQIEVNGDSANRLAADAVSDILNITSGLGITLSKTVGTDTLDISVNPIFDLKGSVFGDDSSILVDGVSGRLVGPVYTATLRTSESAITLGSDAGTANYTIGIGYGAGKTGRGDLSIAIGTQAGETNQGQGAIALGRDAGYSGQGTNTVAVGYEAGSSNQGANAVAIGYRAGYNNQLAGSIVLNASGAAQNAAAAGFYVNPIRSTTSSARPLVYDATTKELFYTSTLEFINSTISTTDSTGLTIDVQTTFNTDVSIENDLDVVQRLRVQGSRVINLNELKSVVASSSSFSDFQTRIAALV